MPDRNSRVRYDVFGAFEVHRKPSKGGKSTLNFSRYALTSFWEKVEGTVTGLRSVAGCRLSAVRAARGTSLGMLVSPRERSRRSASPSTSRPSMGR